MRLRSKFLSIGILLAIIPAFCLSAYIAYSSYSDGKSAIHELSKAQLTAVRESKKSQIERYFQTIQDQVLSFSKDRMIVNAMREFKRGFDDYLSQRTGDNVVQQKEKLQQYYEQSFGGEYAERNNGQKVNSAALMQGLDADSISLQYDFIANNTEPLGAKDALIQLDNNTLYSKLHKIYHPPIRDFLQRFEYFDIFLVTPDTGDIVYSVFKELDY
ncbi:hypothetical protein A3715_13085 [Oleiphilus sp. HI0009]|uniref:hypothetical protein n=2 Tax=Oleiphilus TaxID=141450 RepID=UPI0007C3D683|nr:MULTISPECIES: hypothetical protein [unclassified Oleiphilus]KZX76431.1 hypothetical protein A3715_13085 [Oleiphilus sp. HI0009]KZY65199.1 hypothetical protein A3738_18470 [Oleiphilus sp. HI0066]KZY65689.1 hypothetical protein A3738_08170 [Oleiphilus sp. HI0066]KZY67627.1 hypothetical protein A3739_12355 [Oleiphilus sp. HI0067]